MGNRSYRRHTPKPRITITYDDTKKTSPDNVSRTGYFGAIA